MSAHMCKALGQSWNASGVSMFLHIIRRARAGDAARQRSESEVSSTCAL